MGPNVYGGVGAHAPSVVAFSLLASAVSMALMYFLRDTRQIVPFATLDVVTVVQGMTSSKPYLYMDQLAKQCGKRSFRLPLPIFVVKNFRCGPLSFRLPLPIINRVFVVGDVGLSRRILQDFSSDKPIEIYSSFESITKFPIMFTSMNSVYTKSIRNLAHRAFSSQQSRMRMVAQKHIDHWLDKRLGYISLSDQSGSFDPTDEALAITFYVVCEFAFEYEASHEEYRAFVENIDVALHEFAFRQSTNPLRKLFGFLLPSAWKAEKASTWVRNFAANVLKSFTSRSSEDTEKSSFLALLLQSTAIQDQNCLISEIIMFLFAGHDTSGSMLANSIVVLAQHADVQEKLRHELKAAAGNRREVPFYDNVIREINRYFPVAVMGATRWTRKDFLLDDGTILPKHSICLMPHYLMYRDHSIFRSPDTFDPDRWDHGTKEMKEANFPFSLGSRSCPGKPLALEVTYQFLSRLLLRCSVQLEQEGEPTYLVIQKHSNCRLKAKVLAKER